MVVTRKPSMLRSAEKWISRLDNADTSRSGVHVYRVRYGDARQIARVLNDIFGSGGSRSLDSASNQIAPGSGLTSPSRGVDRLSGGGAGLGGGSNFGGGGGTFGSQTGARSPNPFGGAGAGGGLGSNQGTLGTASNVAAGASLNARSSTSTGGGQPILEGVR